MLKLVKRLFQLFMSNNPPDIYFLLPRTNDDANILFWSSSILGKHIDVANACVLTKLDHCKADRPPKHEFLKAHLLLSLDGKKYEVRLIIHRTPAPNVDVDGNPPKPQRTSTTSLVSPQSTITSRSSSPSPSTFSDHILGMLGKGDPVPATDCVIIIKAGQCKELDDACTEIFGSYITLNTLTVGKEHTAMSASQLATVLEVAHNVAPNYTLKKHQCYWYALIIFLIVRAKTKGKESNQACIKQRGKLWWIAPTHTADDDENVVQDEYDKAWENFEVSRY
jgi:hypothetical protein